MKVYTGGPLVYDDLELGHFVVTSPSSINILGKYVLIVTTYSVKKNMHGN